MIDMISLTSQRLAGDFLGNGNPGLSGFVDLYDHCRLVPDNLMGLEP